MQVVFTHNRKFELQSMLVNIKVTDKSRYLNKNIYLGRNMTIIQQNNIIHSMFLK